MPIASGKRLGPYEIVSLIGAGGMGEVYRAKDTRLDRTVAVKVLSSALTANDDVKARFLREARAVSSFAHPHICVLHDIGNDSGIDFIVMEFLEGETLADRLHRGPLAPFEVLKYGAQVADALDKAHKQGIVHRDLKPGNIMITKNGAKVLDFGLAKEGSARSAISATAMTLMTNSKPLTAEGTIVGTFQYMAPEQIEGMEVDARSDIFALGCVLYEMATGKQAFGGRTQASVIASILASEPPAMSSVVPLTPPALERLVRSCLAKHPDQRIQNAHDVKLQLEWIAEGGSQAGIPAPILAKRRLSGHLAWALAGFFALLALAAFLWPRHGTPPIAVRATIEAPTGVKITPFNFALSPDGKKMVFVGESEKSSSRLWVRQLNSLTAQELAGTENATYPFWSPDSKTVAFFADGKLKKIEAAGGPVTMLADASEGRGGTWSKDRIVYAPAPGGPLSEISASGGTPRVISKYDAQRDDTHRFPWFLPDGRHVVFFLASKFSGKKDTANGLYLLDVDSGKQSFLRAADASAQYSSGHLLFLQQRTLFAQAISPGGKLSGDATPIAEQLQLDSDRFIAAMSASEGGNLIYMPGSSPASSLVWYSRDGKPIEKLPQAGLIYWPRLSPGGNTVAFTLQDRATSNADVWTFDLKRNIGQRITFDPSYEGDSLWSPDQKSLLYVSDKGIMQKKASGLGEAKVIVPGDITTFPNDWSRDGRLLAYMHFESGAPHLWIHSFAAGQADYPLLKTQFAESEGKFSPDGKWLAYVSEESGRSEIYVVPFPSLSGKWQISSGGGTQPAWRGDGKELFYISFEGKMMSVALSFKDETVIPAAPVVLFETKISDIFRTLCQYDFTPDGKKFLINTREQAAPEPLVVYGNWAADLQK